MSRALAALAVTSVLVGLVVMNARPAVVRASAPTPGIVSTYAGGNTTTGYGISIPQYPFGLALSGSTLYISSSVDYRVRALDVTTGVETTYAGNGQPGSSGDGGLATSASLNSPAGLATDAAGNLYIATGDRVREVTPGGVISTVAGGGAGCTDPCSATAAALSFANGVGVDGAGSIYIADGGHMKVRKVAAGTISTVAGTGLGGFSGDGGPAISAELSSPQAVYANASGDLWIADYSNNRIRRVDHSSGLIATVAGGGTSNPCTSGPATSQAIGWPSSVSMDSNGNVLFAEPYSQCVHSLSGSTLTSVAGINSGVPGNLSQPMAAISDPSGNLYIADAGGPAPAVYKISGSTMTRIAGYDNTHCAVYGLGGPATAAMFCRPQYIAHDHAGNLYISDNYGQRVMKVDASTGVLTDVAGDGTQGFAGDGGPATAAKFYGPAGIAFNSSGDLFISDSGNFRVRRVDHSTGNITTVAGNGTQGFSGDGGPALSAELGDPLGLAIDSHDNLFVADLNNYRVRKVDTGGTITTFAGCGVPIACEVGSPKVGPATGVYLNGVYDVALDSADNLYITQTGSLDRVDPGGNLMPFGTMGNEFGVAIGPQDRVFATAGGQAFLVGPSGPAITVAGVPQGTTGATGDGSPAPVTAFLDLYGVAVDASGDIFLAEMFGRRIRRIQAYTAPSAPTAVGGAAANHGSTVHWTAPSDDGGLPIIRYSVTPYSGVTPHPATTVIAPATSTTVPLLINGTPYTFTVAAFNGWGTSPESAHSPPFTPVVGGRGMITTIAGSRASGPPLSIGQDIFSVGASQWDGSVYFGDFSNPVIRSLDSSTQESVAAGNDAFGYSGDGGLVTSATMDGAGAIADCGPDGVYFADTYNYVIRHFYPGGQMATVVGDGTPGYSDGGGDPRRAEIGRVFGLACRTGGGLYIADSDNGAVRIFYPNNTIATWWYGFSFPTGIVELAGAIDVVAVSDDGSDNAVWLLTDSGAGYLAGTPGHAGNSGDGGPAYLSRLNDPQGLAQFGCCGSFSLYIADRGNNRIREVDSSTGLITAFAGSGTAGYLDGDGSTARFNRPAGLGINGLTMYIADTGNHAVRVTTIGGVRTVATAAGNGTLSLAGDGGAATAAQLGAPYAVAFDTEGDAYIVDNLDDVIRKIDLNGTITTVAGNGRPGFSGDYGPATSAQLNDPRGVAIDSAGSIYISDTGNQRVRKVDPSGTITTIAGTGVAGYSGEGTATNARLSYPRAVAVDPSSGALYIADTGNNRIRKVVGTSISTVAGTGSPAVLSLPRGLAFDGSGNLLIADSGNNRIRMLTGATLSTVAGNGVQGRSGDGGPAVNAELNAPFGLAVDGAGTVYVADTGNDRIRAIDAAGVITTVVGICGGRPGFHGDGGFASTAEIDDPFGLAADWAGDVYVADALNNRVRAGFGLTGISRFPACQSPAQPATGARIAEGTRRAASLQAVPLSGHFVSAPAGAKHRVVWKTAAPSAPVLKTGKAAAVVQPAPPAPGTTPPRHAVTAEIIAPEKPATPSAALFCAGVAGPVLLMAIAAAWRRRRRRLS